MKNILLCLLFVLSFTILTGQVSKTIQLTNAGTLSTELTSEELNSITNLTVTGNIDARDFKTMRDLMQVLAEIDLSGTTIVGYEGLEGTSKSGNTIYPSNTVPENAFESKPTLKNIILPNSTEEISQRAFLYCRQLLSATLPSSLLKINDQAFGWCNSLSSILLPESLTYIGYNAFATTNLTEINIPQAVGYIGDVVFFQCRKLLFINVSALNEKYSSVDGVLFNKDQTILIAYPGGKTALDYTFPSSVKKIAVRSFEGSKLSKINLPDGILDVGFEAFTNMYGLKEISIPSSISKIEAGAFAYNANVVSISVDRAIPLAFGGSYGVFDGINKSSCRLFVPFGSKASYQAADQWKDFQNIIEYTTYVPDDNFEQALIDLGYDSGPLDDYVLTEKINGILNLNVSGRNISDLTGIEAFKSLVHLDCTLNNLLQLDVSKNTELTYLVCGNNQLNSIDISNNPKLKELLCWNNKLTSLDVSKNSALTLLDCSTNKIETLDLSNNLLLEALYCRTNQLSILVLSKNTQLGRLDCGNNKLVSLNLKNGENDKLNGTYVDFRGNSMLYCIQVDNPGTVLTYTEWYKDPQANYSSDCSPKTYVPDDNFEQALIDLGYDSGPLDDYVLTENIYSVTDLNVSNKGISDLTGIEGFINLQNLKCDQNQISVLDVSKNTLLKSLTCINNKIANLDLSANTALYHLNCFGNLISSINIDHNSDLKHLLCGSNQLTSIDLSNNSLLEELNLNTNLLSNIDLTKCPNLKVLLCWENSLTSIDLSSNVGLQMLFVNSNKLTTLDVSNNLMLTHIFCPGNLIETLDVSKNSQLTTLFCNSNKLRSLNLNNGNNHNMTGDNGDFNSVGNSLLTCITVDNPDLASTYSDWFKDAIASYSYDCSIKTYVPDDNFEQALINLGYDSGALDDYVPTANILIVKNLSISGRSINDLTGIEDFKILEYLNCSGNNLQQLDVSKNNLLKYLNCNGNKLTTLDVSKNNLLLTLYCSVNQLSELKLNPEGSLKNLSCDNNLLTNLEIENLPLNTIYCRNNLIHNLDLSGCKELKSIYCANNYLIYLNLKNDNNTSITTLDATANPYLNCIMVDNPTLSTGYSGWKKDENASYSDYCEFIRPKMTYIPDDNFEQALIDLRYDSGTLNDSVPTMFIDKITSLIIEGRDIEDLTGIEDFVVLTKLHIAYNKLSSVDLTKNINLIDLRCSANPLEALDISQCVNLNKFECVSNQLVKLDISANIALQELNCADNLLTSLDARNNTKLWSLQCSMNSLSNLSLPQNLRSLSCMNNQLTNVDFSVVDSLMLLTLDDNNIEILDLSKNSILHSLRCSNNQLKKLNLQNGKNQLIGSIRVTNNPNLVCIQVDNPENSLANTQWIKDSQTSYSTSCNNIPIANAGMDQTVEEGSTVTLDGSLSSDADQDNLTFKWTAPGGITLSSASAQKPTFIAPEVTQDTLLIFSLIVNDGFEDSPADQVVITVKHVNKTPVADAGANQTAEEGTIVTLDGSLSSDADQDNLTYKWTAPNGITLSSASAQKPTFIAPEVTQDTQFSFSLIVNDGFEDSSASQVVVTVKQVNKTPVADAGSDQIIEEGAVVILDGTLSSDADGDSLIYEWTTTDGIILSSSSAQKPVFTAPEVTQDTQFTFSLIVNDGFEDSPADQVVVTVKQVNKTPVANAGVDQIVKTGDKVVLNGTGSFDPDQDTLVYSWTSLNGITLNVDSDPSPFFFAPVTKNNSDLIFTLTVSDGSASSKTDTVIISVENKSPVISVKTFFDGTISSAEQVSYELYKETDGKFGKYTATFSSENNTATFNVEEGNWMVLAIPSVTETNFIPTYFGNSITWNEAEIITVQGEEIVDLEIDCQKVKVETTGEYSIEGYVYQEDGTKSCVILSSTTGNNPAPGTKVLLFREDEIIPVRTTITDNEGKYIFNSLNLADYKVIVDIPGFDQVDVWNIKLDSVTVSVINVNFTVITSLGVITDIPDTELKTSIYPNPTTGKLYIKTENWPRNSKIEVFNSIGKLIYHSLHSDSSFLLDLSNKPDGVYILNISSNKKKETVKIVLRK